MSVALLGLWLTLAATPANSYLEVSARDPAGEDCPALAASVARALVATSATVVVGPGAQEHCGNRCVRLTVSEQEPGRFRIEARQAAHFASSLLEIPESATALERSRAIAVQARLLIDWPTPPEPVRTQVVQVAAAATPPPPATVSAAPAPAAAPTVPAEAAPLAAEPTRTPVAPISQGSVEVVPEVPLAMQAEAQGPAASALSLDVALTVLGGRDTDFVSWGSTLRLRGALAWGLEVQLAAALLDSTKGVDAIGRFRQRPRPLLVGVAWSTPFVPDLKLGLGAEFVSIDLDRFRDPDADSRTDWSPGAVTSVEYRRQFWRFSVLGQLYAALHPRAAREQLGGGAMLLYPTWTFGAMVGMGFGLL